jgi:hypothetical protein
MSPLRWITKSTCNPADELTRQGHKVSAENGRDLLQAEGFSLRGNTRTIEGRGTRIGTPSSRTSTPRSRTTRPPPTQ